MGSVGAGTEIHHVQVSYSFDDSYEWFGGTVNCSNLVAYGGFDDEFDTDFGFRGKLQYLFGYKDPDSWDPASDLRGFESDNDGSSSSTATPYTRPIITNATIIGPERADGIFGSFGSTFDYSAVVRRSSQLSLYNSVIMGIRMDFLSVTRRRRTGQRPTRSSGAT